MQHHPDTSPFRGFYQHLGAFWPIMDVQNISAVQAFQQREENTTVNGFLYPPGGPVQERVDLIA
jgi:hypothetical protein